MSLIKPGFLRETPQELGKIKIGKRGPDHPERQGYFTVTTMHRGDDGNFLADEVIHAKIGPEPTELQGILMFPEVSENFHSEMQVYRGRTRKVWTCDGEEAVDLEKGEVVPCARAHGGNCQCRPYGRLHLQLWDAPALGYHVFRTTSWNSVSNIQTALGEIFLRFGTLFHAPVILRVFPKEVTFESDGQRRAGTAFVVGLVLQMTLSETAQHMIQTRSELAEAGRLLEAEIPSTAVEVAEALRAADIREEAEIGEEFHHDTGEPDGDTSSPPPVAAPEPSPEQALGPERPASKEDIDSLTTLVRACQRLDKVLDSELEVARQAVSSEDGPVVRLWIEELRSRIAATQLDPEAFNNSNDDAPEAGDLFHGLEEPEGNE